MRRLPRLRGQRPRRTAPPFDITAPEEDMGRAISEHFPDGWERRPNFQVHVLRSLFFRNKGAYAIGRVVNGSSTMPLPLRAGVPKPRASACATTAGLARHEPSI